MATRRGAWVVGFGALGHTLASAHPSDYAVPLAVTAVDEPPALVLSWPTNVSAGRYEVARRRDGEDAWQAVAAFTNAAGAVSGWTDMSVAPGRVYEYSVVREAREVRPGRDGRETRLRAGGFALAAIRRPAADARGGVVLLVADNVAAGASNEVARLRRDLVADGWTVRSHVVPSVHWNAPGWRAAVTNNKALIRAAYAVDPAGTKAVFLLGHVAVPYSGDLAPDGHDNHRGAWPADAYYGDVTGVWTDARVNTPGGEPRGRNVPGDGRFDNSATPGTVSLQVGRVDFHGMPVLSPLTELDLVRRYLDKDHAYRLGTGVRAPRGLIDDNFGDFNGEAFAANGWRNFGHLYGPTNTHERDFLGTLASETYEWAYGCGPGSHTWAGGIGVSADFARSDPKVNFTMLFGSFFGDWDVDDALMRAVLATRSSALSCSWGARPGQLYHFMALGETLGECIRRTQNNTNGDYRTNRDRNTNRVHVALLGDPTLRLNRLPPPSGLQGQKRGGRVELRWTASPGAQALGYNVYRAPSEGGRFERLNRALVTGTSYLDPAATTGERVYLVRPVALTVSRAGSYTNIGQGAMVRVGDAPNELPQAQPLELATDEDAATALRLRATDPDGDALRYEWDAPLHGTLAGVAPDLLYVPDPDFNGKDAFGYRVDDGRAVSETAAVTVSIRAVSDAPRARFGMTPDSGGAPLQVKLDAADSRDADGDAIAFAWDFGDGSAAGASRVEQHTYAAPGNYVVRLTVRDAGGMGATTNRLLVISNMPPAVRVVSPTDGVAVVSGTVARVTLAVEVTDDGFPAPATLTQTWSRIAGPGGVAFANARCRSTTVTVERAGTHVLRLTASDGLARTARDVVLHVAPRPGSILQGHGVRREWWSGLPGSSVNDLTACTNYPARPSGTDVCPAFEAPINWADNYGTRLHGYFVPVASGPHRFLISSDDSSELWLSADATTNGLRKVAEVVGCTSIREWSSPAARPSSNIWLEAGQPYYMRALQKEGPGADHIAIGADFPDGTTHRPIEGVYLAPYGGRP